MKELKHLKPAFNLDLPKYRDLRELLNGSAARYPKNNAFIIKHKKSKTDISYEYITFEMFRDQVNQLGAGMLQAGFAGKNMAIIGKNSYPWLQSYFAVLCGLGTCVPLDRGLPYDELESSLIRSYADVLIYDPDMTDMIEEIKKNGNTQVKTFIAMREHGDELSVPALMEEGRKVLESGDDTYLNLPIDPQAVTILLFTSGTTSMAKAVMLSQDNLTSNVYALLRCEDVRSTDVNMAFLPYHHTFGSTGQLVMIGGGAATAYCDGLKYLQKNIVEYKVSLFFCVPLLVESIYKRVMATVKKQGIEKKVAFGRKLSKFLLKFGIDIRRKLFKEILDQLGGNLRFVISGAAAIDPEAIEGFNDFGITAVQGYGMTEAAPVITAENHNSQEYGSIGRPIEGVEVKIDQPNEEGIGELIARGPNVMHGYFENEEATAEKGLDVLEAMLDMDESSRHLGEVALVPYNSPINQTGILFLNTLFDENACCHLAFGRAFKNNVKNFENMTDEDFEAIGFNQSVNHVDFMIGSEDLDITGYDFDGKSYQIFKDGVWAF
mgnify:CR=1 FL=1